jgi:hypothetical protein
MSAVLTFKGFGMGIDDNQIFIVVLFKNIWYDGDKIEFTAENVRQGFFQIGV